MNPNTIAKNRLKPPKSFFEWCDQFFPIYEFERKGVVTRTTKDINPHRRVVRMKVRTNTNYRKLIQHRQFVIVLATKKRIEIQTYVFHYKIKDDLTEHFEMYLRNIELFTNSKRYVAGCIGQGEYRDYLIPWQYMSGPYLNAWFYSSDINDILKKSELRHFKVKGVYDAYGVKYFRRLYSYRLGLEYLKKIGGYRLFDDIVNGYADMRVVTKPFIRRNTRMIKNNYSWNEIYYIDLLKSNDIEPNLKSLPFASDYPKLVKKYISIGKYGRLQNYLVKQNSTLQYYEDYHLMIMKLNIEFESDLMRFPKDLIAAHNEKLETIQLIEAEEKAAETAKMERKAKRISKIIKKLEFECGPYAVVAPKTLSDIVEEGSNLVHCVGQTHYLERHSRGEEVVLFVREKGKEDQSFHTFSFDMKSKITQVQGYCNESTDLRDTIETLLRDVWLPQAMNVIRSMA